MSFSLADRERFAHLQNRFEIKRLIRRVELQSYLETRELPGFPEPIEAPTNALAAPCRPRAG